MESKLKALKVADLKDIISKANLSVTGRANKPDLINKILASSEAIAVYESQYGDNKNSAPPNGAPAKAAPTTGTEQLSPAEETTAAPAAKPHSRAGASDAGSATLSSVPTPTPKISEIPATSADASHDKPTSPAGVPAVTTPAEDEEAAKRRARAARFGIPVVEPSTPTPKADARGKKGAKGVKADQPVLDDPEKLSARAARFGVVQPTSAAVAAAAKETPKAPQTNGRKRSAPADEPLDPEELERRKKRAERFGAPVVGAKA